MPSIWYKFINDYVDSIPYKPLSVILEAFYWYCQMAGTTDETFRKSCDKTVNDLLMK